MGKLSDVAIRNAKGVRKLSDGHGLQLWLTASGSKLWRMEYRDPTAAPRRSACGKPLYSRKLLSFGPYPLVSLAEARSKAAEALALLRAGKDPSAERQAARASTFATFAHLLRDKLTREGKSASTIARVDWLLAKLPFRNAHVASISTGMVTAALLAHGPTDTALRLRTFTSAVMRLALQHGAIAHDPVAATRGLIAAPRRTHRAAVLTPEALADLLRAIDAYAARNVIAGSALQLMAVLYPRPGELRQAEWREFDLDKSVWTIPAVRVKLRRDHAKPLAPQAVAILRTLWEITGPDGHVFSLYGRAMGEATMNAALVRMGVPKSVHSPHGFRATASTLLNGIGRFASDTIERELDHLDSNTIRRAYNRGQYWDDRCRMATWWADYLDSLRADKPAADNVIAFK